MNLFPKDESLFQLNNNEFKIGAKRRGSNINIENKIKMDFECPSPKQRIKRLNSNSNLQIKKRRKSMNKHNNNILNDYLHSHKFGIQTKIFRKKTFKEQKKDNHLSLKMNKSYYENNNKKNFLWLIIEKIKN